MNLDEIARAALRVDGIESAVIFVAAAGSSQLELAAAAGVSGPALDSLVAAVQRPDHPVARALSDADTTFDVRPMNPGGPALRSHLPLGGRGVLAVAHDVSLSADDRRTLVELAAAAVAAIRS